MKRAVRFQSTIQYSRQGEQVDVAPKQVKQISRLSNGVTLVTLDHHHPQSAVAVYLNAGSRHDPVSKPGAAHVFKRSLIRTTPNSNVIQTVMDAEFRGNSLFAEVGREHLIFGSELLRDDVVDAVPTLIDSVFNPKFEVYELLKAQHQAAEQTRQLLSDPFVAVEEKLNELAFRRGLGFPVFADKHAAAELDRKSVLKVRDVDPSRIAVVATGVSHTDLEPLVQEAFSQIELTKNDSKEEPTVYYGGEGRINAGPKASSIFTVAYPGASFANKGYYSALVLEQLLNGKSRAKWGNPKIGTENASVVGFHESFSDAGLVGFRVVGKASDIKQVASAALKALKSSPFINAQQFEAAKNAAIISAEDLKKTDILESLGKEATTHTDFLLNVEGLSKLTLSEFTKFAQIVVNAKPTVVAYGNLAELPYFDEL